MKALSDVKLSYVIQKIKETFSLKGHTHDLVEKATYADTAKTTDGLKKGFVILVRNDREGGELCHGTGTTVVGTHGVLPAEKGGTGVESLDALSDLINPIKFMRFNYTGSGTDSLTMILPGIYFPEFLFLTDNIKYGGRALFLPFGEDPSTNNHGRLWGINEECNGFDRLFYEYDINNEDNETVITFTAKDSSVEVMNTVNESGTTYSGLLVCRTKETSDLIVFVEN